MMLAALLFLQVASTQPLYVHLEMCAARNDGSCSVAAIDVEGLSTLHRTISETIVTVANPDPNDPWTAFPRDAAGRITGDCDDQVATERAALIALGLDPKGLTIEYGEVVEADGHIAGHVVLVVDLGAERYVLDRRVPQGVYLAAKRPKSWTPRAIQSHTGVLWRTP